VLTTVLVSVTQYNTMHALGVSGQWVNHTAQAIQEISETRRDSKAGESAARGFALTGDPAFLSALKESVASANQHEREMRRLTADNPRQQRRLDQYETLLAQHSAALDELVNRRRSLGDAAAAEFLRADAPTLSGDALGAVGRELQSEEASLLNGRRVALERGAARTEAVSVGASILSLLLLGIAGTLIHFDTRRRKKLEAELRHEQDLFATLMDRLPDRVYFKDAESRFLRVNAATARHMGLSDVTGAIGKCDADFYSAEHAAMARADEQEVFQTGKPLIEHEELEALVGGHARWALSSKLPLVDRDGSIIGTFGISRDITASKKAERALENANARLTGWNAELELRNREIILLSEMGELLQTCVNEAEAEAILCQFARDLCPALSGSLSMIKASRNLVEMTASWGETAVLAVAFSPDDCWALRRGRPHGSGRENGRLKCAHIEAAFTGAFVCVPMMAHGEMLGVLHLLRSDGQELNEAEMRLASMVGERIGQSIANLRLRDALKAQSIRDPLTGLFNRRYMEESLERELHRADRQKSPVGAIMVDLDHFKRFNDSFGHDGGDVVLRKFSELMLARTRKEDIICRFGGEEFLIVLPGMSLEDTRNLAESMVVAARSISVVSRGRELGPVSISAGVAMYPEDGSTMGALIRAADDALYLAKTQGRDRAYWSAAHAPQGRLAVGSD